MSTERTTCPLAGLVIRTAAVRDDGVGYLYCGDPVLEKQGRPHAISFRVQSGEFARGDANFDVSTCCIISTPCPGLMSVAGSGYYSVLTVQGNDTGDMFADSNPRPETPRTGGIRQVAEIDGMAYAVGLRGCVYRYEARKTWRRIDEGLPSSFDGQAIHGFSADDLYAVGRSGAIWHRSATGWQHVPSPTNATLTSVICAGDGRVYVAGHHGVLLQGGVDGWSLIEHTATDDTVWDLAWFQGALYASTLNTVYRLQDGRLVAVDFGADRPASCYQLSTCGEAMWSSGEFDVMRFDGQRWTRIAGVQHAGA